MSQHGQGWRGVPKSRTRMGRARSGQGKERGKGGKRIRKKAGGPWPQRETAGAEWKNGAEQVESRGAAKTGGRKASWKEELEGKTKDSRGEAKRKAKTQRGRRQATAVSR